MGIFVGSGTAICTPFCEDGSFNLEEYGRLIKFQIDNATDAIISCGTTGEISTLDNDEHVEVVRAAVEFVKNSDRRVPVIAGGGGNDTRNIMLLTKRLQQVGADAIMLVTPYYNKTSQRGLVEHYTEIAKNIDLPIMLYNVPSRTSLNITPDTMAELAKIDNIVAVKEASANISQIAEIAEKCDITLYSGNDDHVVPVLSLGGKGVVSTISNIAPRQMHDLVMNFLEGKTQDAAKIQLAMLPLLRLLFADVNPMPVKTALNLMGFNAGRCRRPLTTIDDSLKAELTNEMKRYGLL